MNKKPTWRVLEERDRYTPGEQRVMFSRQSKGSPRLFFNIAAADALDLKAGARLQLLAPSEPNGRPILGLRPALNGAGSPLIKAGNTRSLRLTSNALAHLSGKYRKIIYRPRAGKDDEPTWVLEPIDSEMGART
jgi:hypothetical protein